jgi:hypothetical protein
LIQNGPVVRFGAHRINAITLPCNHFATNFC